jgi:acetyl esterase/lipase
MNHSSAGDAAGLPSLISMLVLGVASLLLNSLPPQAAHGAQFLGEFSYYSPGSTDPSLVVYVPDGGADPEVPTLLYIHGGGWGSGNQGDNLAVLMPIVDAGYSLVSCNYTLSTHVSPSYPQAVHDVKAVVRWIRTQGLVHSLSATIIGTGPSAGGHLVELLGTSSGVDALEPIPFPGVGYRLQGAIPLSGLCDFVTQVQTGGNTIPFQMFLGGPLNPATLPIYIEASGLTWVSEDDCPMRHAHGTLDDIHDVEQAEIMHDALLDVGVSSTLDIFTGGHGFSEYVYGGQMGFAAFTDMVIQEVPGLLASGRTADVDQDRDVDTDDLLKVLAAWGQCPSLPRDCPCDIDGDGLVAVDELLAVIEKWSS